MAIFTGNGNLTGGTGGDIIVSTNPVAPPPPGRPVLLGGDGSDAIVLSHGPVILENPNASNNSLATALNIDAAGFWASGNNPLVSDPARPYATIAGTLAPRSTDCFALTVGSSQAISLDVDFAQRYGGGFDAKLTLYDNTMTAVATTDDSSPLGGGEGSDPGGQDPTLYYVARYTGTYYVRVSGGSTFDVSGGGYILNLSVTGHAATGSSATLGESADGQNGDDYLVGGSGSDQLYGSAGNDTLYGNAGADGLHGGAGDDLVDGGDGIDTIYFEAALAGVTVDLSSTAAQNTVGDGVDTIVGVENVSASAFDDTITGNNAANVIFGGLGDDHLNGGGGDDAIHVGSYNGVGQDVADGGAGGYDTLMFDVQSGDWTIDLRSGHGAQGQQTVDFTNFEAVVGSLSNDTLYAVAGRDVAGGYGSDYIYAAGGQSALDGGDFATASHGNDTIDTTLMVSAGQSFRADLANSLTSVGGLFFTDFDNYVGGDANDDVTGSTYANTIRTGAGDDTIHAGEGGDQLYGGPGVDTIYGEAGDDTLHVVASEVLSAGDLFDGGDGTDALLIENGVDADISGVTIAGLESIRVTGGHALTLGAGQLSGLHDLIASTVSLSTAGTIDLHGATIATGAIRLADGSNRLDLAGAANTGALSVFGGAGSDTVLGRDWGDLLDGGGGNDKLTGGVAADQLVGGTGGDTMTGGLGDDRYEVDSARDRVVERGNGGYDTVSSSVTYTLTAHVEALVLAGTRGVGGNGNADDNVLTGNSGANALSGLDGADRLVGGGGADTLTGGAGADAFVFADVSLGTAGGWSKDEITDFVHGEDRIDLAGASAIAKFRDLVITDDGGTAVIATGHGDAIRVDGVAAASLRASDFVFAQPSPATAVPIWTHHFEPPSMVHLCLA